MATVALAAAAVAAVSIQNSWIAGLVVEGVLDSCVVLVSLAPPPLIQVKERWLCGDGSGDIGHRN